VLSASPFAHAAQPWPLSQFPVILNLSGNLQFQTPILLQIHMLFQCLFVEFPVILRTGNFAPQNSE
jgi:hypothetical protein